MKKVKMFAIIASYLGTFMAGVMVVFAAMSGFQFVDTLGLIVSVVLAVAGFAEAREIEGE